MFSASPNFRVPGNAIMQFGKKSNFQAGPAARKHFDKNKNTNPSEFPTQKCLQTMKK